MWHWCVSSVPLVFTLFIYYAICTDTLLNFIFLSPHIKSIFTFNRDPYVVWIILAGFAAAQANMYSTLFRAVNNFDLSPSTFVEVLIDIVIGMTAGLLVYYCAPIITVSATSVDTTLFQKYFTPHGVEAGKFGRLFLVVFAFVSAYYPDVIKRNVVRAAKLTNYKSEDDDIFKAFQVTPIEIIDGIDSTIRRRLEDFHIYSVQNLATANPLMLYVETPYGVYQMLDWVAQAQLISVFGPNKIKQLWKYGVRTIFDLERLARDPLCHNKFLSRSICKILISDITEADGEHLDWDRLFFACVNCTLENSHVHRLRQIVMLLSDRIGPDSRRLPLMPGGVTPECCLGCVKSG